MRVIQRISSKTACAVVGAAFEAARADFPAVVRIETTNACNARCTICPHDQIKRPIARMDDELFGRLIDQCADGRCKEVHLHNFGEPLLDKHLPQRVRMAKDLGIAKVKIFSNGSLLSKDRARELVEAGLDEIKISFDGATREEFERIRVPLKFDDVVGNIKDLVAVRNEMASPMKIRVACCSTTDKQGTMQSLERIVDGFSFGKIHNWGGESNGRPPGKVRKPCSRIWRTFTVLSSGEVALCCLDYDGQCILGRLDENTTIRDIWNGDAYRRIRLQHRQARQDEIELCRHCTKAFV